jgi:hypothetical protein
MFPSKVRAPLREGLRMAPDRGTAKQTEIREVNWALSDPENDYGTVCASGNSKVHI